VTPSAPPATINPFYAQYVDANGISVVASSRVDPDALVQACIVVMNMLDKRDDVRRKMMSQGMLVAIIATSEVTTDLPEYADLNSAFPGGNWDSLRGVGATLARPASSVGEENILCLPNDPYADESVLVQTFSSSVLLGVEAVDTSFQPSLQLAFADAKSARRWQGTFATVDEIEYYAMGVQNWFDAYAWTSPSSGPDNQINTRAELEGYDPTLFELVGKTMPPSAWRPRCP
jgi:hypothetical protein